MPSVRESRPGGRRGSLESDGADDLGRLPHVSAQGGATVPQPGARRKGRGGKPRGHRKHLDSEADIKLPRLGRQGPMVSPIKARRKGKPAQSEKGRSRSRSNARSEDGALDMLDGSDDGASGRGSPHGGGRSVSQKPAWNSEFQSEAIVKRTSSMKLSKGEVAKRHVERQSHNLSAARVELRFKGQKAKLDKKKARLAEEEDRLNTIYDFVEEERRRIKEAELRLVARVQMVESAVAAVAQEKALVDSKHKRLKEERDAMRGERLKLEDREATLETLRTEFSEKTLKRERDLDKLKASLAQQKLESDRLSNELISKRQEMMSVEMKLAQEKEELVKMHADLEDTRDGVGERERHTKRLKHDVASSQRDIAIRARELDEREAKLEQAEGSLKDRKNAYQLEAADLIVKRNAIDSETSQIKVLRMEVTALKIKLATQQAIAQAQVKDAKKVKTESLALVEEAKSKHEAAVSETKAAEQRASESEEKVSAAAEQIESLKKKEVILENRARQHEKKIKAIARAKRKAEELAKEAQAAAKNKLPRPPL